ncbi:MAG TPA: GNAT family N-acetyltransferase [Clostridiaceae bacterium]
MDIQKSKVEDIPSIMELFNSCVENMRIKGIYQWDNLYPNLEIINQDIYKEQAFSIIINSSEVATITLNQEQSPEYKDITWIGLEPVLVIHRLAVHPNNQKQGLAKSLMTFAEDYAKDKGCSSIRLDAFTENPISLGLYDHLGYKIRGQVYFPGKSLPFYCLEKLF